MFVFAVPGIELKASITEPTPPRSVPFISRQDLRKLRRLVSISESSCLSLPSGGFRMKEELRGISVERSPSMDRILDSVPSAEKNKKNSNPGVSP